MEQNIYLRAKVILVDTVYSNDIYIEIIPLPETPTITKVEKTLISSAEIGNQWYNWNGLIPDAIEQYFTPTENGTYYVTVTLDICPSKPSNYIFINEPSIIENVMLPENFVLYPNPADKQLIIKNEKFKINRVVLIDVLGKEVINMQQNNVNEATINVAKIAAGVYQVRIETDNGIFTSKVVKQ